MYGCDHNMSRFTPQATVDLRCETAVEGLYLSGQDVFSCGLIGAAFGGMFCAGSVLGRNVFQDMLDLKEKLK
jgi:all-trans-retinol 13,14-reductase